MATGAATTARAVDYTKAGLPLSVVAYKRAARRARRSSIAWATLVIGPLSLPAFTTLVHVVCPGSNAAGLTSSLASPALLLASLPTFSALSCLAWFAARRCVEDRKLAATYELCAVLCHTVPELLTRRAGTLPRTSILAGLLSELGVEGVKAFSAGREEAASSYDIAAGIRETLVGTFKKPSRTDRRTWKSGTAEIRDPIADVTAAVPVAETR